MRNTQHITERTLKFAHTHGAAFAEVFVSQGASSLKRVVGGQVYQPPAGEGLSISIGAIVDGRRINTSLDNPDAIESEIQNAFSRARILPRENDIVFPSAPYPKASIYPHTVYDAATAQLDDARLAETIGCVNAVVASEGFVFDGMVGQGADDTVFANSAGTYQEYRATSAQLVIFGFDPSDRSISAYTAIAGKALAAFPAEKLAQDVVRKLALQREHLAKRSSRINPFGASAGPKRFDVIFEPSCTAGLLAIFSGQAEAWNGKAFHEGTSFFAGKLGKKVMGENITILDDPLHPQGIPQPFDGEGYPKQKLLLVEKGIARNVVYDTALARKYGTTTTGHALSSAWRHMGAYPGHLVVGGGDSSIEEMILASEKPTIWVSTLHYIRATHAQDGCATGSTIHGAFLVENGEIQGPIEHLRFDESVPEALSRVTHLGRSVPTLSMETEETPYIVPPMRIEGFRFVSAADRSV